MKVLKDWTESLTLQMQGVLVCAMRGPDNVHKEDPAKVLVRAFRALVTNNARPLGPENTFAGDGSPICTTLAVSQFFASVDHYPHHWYLHFAHAAEIVGYCHPEENVRRFWIGIYQRICEDMHVNPETEMQMRSRLRGDGKK